MATSSRQSSVFGVNDWKSIYKTYSQADFQSYDYETLRKNFVDYLRASYPETFNDYVESSEYIALLDIIAFMGQGLAFRNDLNTRENFIDTAERRDSVIKLANLVGYSPKRNAAGQGFLKIVSLQTTESLRDINGVSLTNLSVLWNDPANPNWQEQFNTVLNAIFIDAQRVGRPGNSQTLLDIKTDEYSIRIPANTVATAPFSATVDGTSMNFECVSVTSFNSPSLYEKSPAPDQTFNILYRNDRLGFGSPSTGFFMYFKQGSLQTYNFNIAEQISNQIVDLNIAGVNNADTWLYSVNSITNALTEWTKVDSVFANQGSKESNNKKKIFSVSSRYNDQVSYNFGDGVFSEIPIGNFTAYVRTSNGLTYSIDPSEFQGVNITLRYVSRTGRTETLLLTLELPLPVTNAQVRESAANIKTRAPQRYYSQNRMVNGEDYNNFPFTLYSSIIKSKALNRTSVGVSRNFDLLDPSGKFSSTNDFADDGGLYLDESEGYINFNPNTTSEIINFLTETLSNILSGHRAYQYYIQHYPWVDFPPISYQYIYYWQQTTYNASETTGYLYNYVGPAQIGTYVSGNAQYITPGALLRFVPPEGYYFDQYSNMLIEGLSGPQDVKHIWTSVVSVTGDGANNGEGVLSNGLGPVVLSSPIPTKARLTTVIPSFTNSIPTTVVQDCITEVNLNKNFTLIFDNSLLANQNRWSIGEYDDPRHFVKFQSLGSNNYRVTYKSLAYYFASVSDIRFNFDRSKIIYDPLTGKVMQDYINILKSNSQPTSNAPFPRDLKLRVVGQPTESDGYIDDYSVEVSSIDASMGNVIQDPDFFRDTTGYVTGFDNIFYYVFFQRVVDNNMLTRYVMIDSGSILSSFPTFQDINAVKYEFPVGSVFFALFENKFYQSVNDTTSANIYRIVGLSDYVAKTGRQGLYFQYRHISDNTTRINPATTNIIDLYLVTQSYYTQYQNWIKDTTGIVPQPSSPTINELNQEYSNINTYKMLTDSVVLNSVKFKPLFGNKAAPNLRATIKIIKSGTTTASDSEIRTTVLSELNNYFSIDNWDFGDTFYFSELSAYLHSRIGDLVNSVVLVPNDPNLSFGELYEIRSAPYEIFVNCAQATDITVISALTPAELQIR